MPITKRYYPRRLTITRSCLGTRKADTIITGLPLLTQNKFPATFPDVNLANFPAKPRLWKPKCRQNNRIYNRIRWEYTRPQIFSDHTNPTNFPPLISAFNQTFRKSRLNFPNYPLKNRNFQDDPTTSSLAAPARTFSCLPEFSQPSGFPELSIRTSSFFHRKKRQPERGQPPPGNGFRNPV